MSTPLHSLNSQFLILDDPSTPLAHKALLQDQARRELSSSWEVRLCSELFEPFPKSWRISTVAGKRLWAKKRTLGAKVQTILLDANLFPHSGSLALLAKLKDQYLYMDDALGLSSVVVINPLQRTDQIIAEKSDEKDEYDFWASWHPTWAHRTGFTLTTALEGDAVAFDLQRLDKRPWITHTAPANESWIKQFQALAAREPNLWNFLEQDLSNGLVRTTLRAELVDSNRIFSAGFFDNDRFFRSTETSLSDSQLRLIGSYAFAKRMRKQRKAARKYVSSFLESQAPLHHRVRKALGDFKFEVLQALGARATQA